MGKSIEDYQGGGGSSGGRLFCPKTPPPQYSTDMTGMNCMNQCGILLFRLEYRQNNKQVLE